MYYSWSIMMHQPSLTRIRAAILLSKNSIWCISQVLPNFQYKNSKFMIKHDASVKFWKNIENNFRFSRNKNDDQSNLTTSRKSVFVMHKIVIRCEAVDSSSWKLFLIKTIQVSTWCTSQVFKSVRIIDVLKQPNLIKPEKKNSISCINRVLSQRFLAWQSS